jgi:hypothetical protein
VITDKSRPDPFSFCGQNPVAILANAEWGNPEGEFLTTL